VHLLGTIFIRGLIHIRCSFEYLWQQDAVCVFDSTVLMFMATVWLSDMFFNSFWTTVELYTEK